MESRRDDEALAWDGDDDPTLVTSAPEAVDAADELDATDAASAEVAEPLPEGWSAVGRGSEAVTTVESSRDQTPEGVPAAAGNAALLVTGVLAGVYLLYAIGWLIGGLRLQGVAQFLVSDAMFVPALWLAVAAPILWFATVFVSTRRSRPWVRYVWLAVGVLLLVPWPFIMMGAVGV